MRGEDLHESHRAALAGEPGEWAGGWLEWLKVRTGKTLCNEIGALVDGARSGAIETCDVSGNAVPSGAWTLSFLDIETLEMIHADGRKSVVLFARDAVLHLRASHNVTGATATPEMPSVTSTQGNRYSETKLNTEFAAYVVEQQGAGLRVVEAKAVEAMKKRVSPGVTRKAVRNRIKALPEQDRRKRGRAVASQIAKK
jgi:hypothetical protein